jgi:IS1 family transposase
MHKRSIKRTMNRLSSEDRARILHLLCEGQSIRATVRLTGASKNTISKLLVTAGQACMAYQDRVLVNLPCKRVEVDELWSFVGSKEKNVPAAKKNTGEMGDVWTWVALDAETKLVAAWYIGDRDAEAAMFFMDNLAKRLANRVQLTSDGHNAYLGAVDTAFPEIDYAMLVKIYGATRTAPGRYSPAECIGARKAKVFGNPDPKYISTSYVERNNGIIRQHCKRYARLTQAFSKKVENHMYAFALHTMYHNFVKISAAHRMTPAMAAKVESRLWEMSDIVKVIEEWEAKDEAA